MPRRSRIVVPGVPHHITQRGNGRADVFRSPDDYFVFLDLLSRHAKQYSLEIWGYCLMPNHFHLIAVPEHERSTANAMQRLESDYARFFNVRRDTSGHLWQARFYSTPMAAVHSWRALAYVELNPVRAGLVHSPEAYQWSSAKAHLGVTVPPPWLQCREWNNLWTVVEWRNALSDSSGAPSFAQELQEATMSGLPLGKDLIEKLERETGILLRRGKAGRPRVARATIQQLPEFAGAEQLG